MIQRLLRLFESPQAAPDPLDAERRVRVATCALLVEMAQIDSEFTETEQNHILELMQEQYGLAESYVQEILELAREELRDSVHLWRFTNLINQHYSREEKHRIIEMIWRIVYLDGKLDRYEDHLVHRLAQLLNLTHRELIHAKLRVLQNEPNPGTA